MSFVSRIPPITATIISLSTHFYAVEPKVEAITQNLKAANFENCNVSFFFLEMAQSLAHDLFIACVVIASVCFGIAMCYFRRACKLDIAVTNEEAKLETIKENQRCRESNDISTSQIETKIDFGSSSSSSTFSDAIEEPRSSKHEKILEQQKGIYDYNHLIAAWKKSIQPVNDPHSFVW